MLDGVLQVFVKYEGEPDNKYAKLFDYNLGYTPLGYVQIWGYGDDFAYVQNNMALGRESYCANFWIDNLKLENKDQQANLVEAGVISSKFPEQEDYVYVDRWDNRSETLFAADAPTTEVGCSSTLGIGAATIMALVGGAFVVKKGGKEE